MSLEQIVEHAGKHFAQGDYSSALVLFQRALNACSSSSSQHNQLVLHSNIGAVLMSMQQLDSALVSLDRALSIDPAHLESQFNKGLVLQLQGRLTEAVQCFDVVAQNAASAQPGSSSTAYLAQCSKCEVLLQLGQFELARDTAQRAASAADAEDPNDFAAWALLGTALFHLKNFAAANAAFAHMEETQQPSSSGMMMDPASKRAYSTSLMEEALELGDVRKMQRAIEVHPSGWENYHNLGVMLMKREGNPAAARRAFEKALEKNAVSVPTLTALGSLCLEVVNKEKEQDGGGGVDELARAVVLLSRACELAPNHRVARFNLAVALARQNEVQRAREEFSKVAVAGDDVRDALAILDAREGVAAAAAQVPTLPKTESFVLERKQDPTAAAADNTEQEEQREEEEEAVQQMQRRSSRMAIIKPLQDTAAVVPSSPKHLPSSSPPPTVAVLPAVETVVGEAAVEPVEVAAVPSPAPVVQEPVPVASSPPIPPVAAAVVVEEEPVAAAVVVEEPVASSSPIPVATPVMESRAVADATSYVPYAMLKFPQRPPAGVDPARKETYLSPSEFLAVFARTAAEFQALPAWKKTLLKKDAGLF